MARSILTPQRVDFPRWYQDVVAKAELAENGPVRGTMVIRPYGYAIWERFILHQVYEDFIARSLRQRLSVTLRVLAAVSRAASG